jgi:hypothetical protein
MQIIKTEIPDIIYENINQHKLNLSNRVIEAIFPLFDEMQEEKRNEIIKLTNELKLKKEKLTEQKNKLQKMMKSYNHKKKLKKLSDRIKQLINAGMINSKEIENETILLLRILSSLSEDQINKHLKNFNNLILAKYSKSPKSK